MGPSVGLDGCGKSRPPLGFDPRTVQPVASRYTDYATRPLTAVVADFTTYRKYSQLQYHWCPTALVLILDCELRQSSIITVEMVLR